MVCGLTIQGDLLLSGEGKGVAKGRLWSISPTSGEMLAVFSGHTGPIWSTAMGEKVRAAARRTHDQAVLA